MSITLAEIKRRLTVGTVIWCTQNAKGPQEPPLYRRVVIARKNSVAFATAPVAENDEWSKLSWLTYGKASSIHEIPGGFEMDNELHPDGFKIKYLWNI